MRTIIFDCDGVLIDSEILYQEIQMQALADIGLTYERQAYVTRFMGTGDKNYYHEVGLDYMDKFETPLPKYFKPNLKKKLELEFAARLRPVRDIHSLLEGLIAPKAVASSSHLDFLHVKLKQTQLDHFFVPHIYSADMVPRAKPFPDLFLHTAQQLGAEPGACVVVEDSVNGVKAGIAAGMYVIGFCGGLHCDDAHALQLKNAGAQDIAMETNELMNKLNFH
jgi:HAD superfamily hydrolase (TIGR01509 family)